MESAGHIINFMNFMWHPINLVHSGLDIAVSHVDQAAITVFEKKYRFRTRNIAVGTPLTAIFNLNLTLSVSQRL